MVEEALYLLTARGAWATFEEEDKGSLEVGKLADLVILSEDPTAVPSKSLADVDVLATIIGGQPQYCAQGAESLCVSAAT
jgi:predicted amidohydrolase YtcJ